MKKLFSNAFATLSLVGLLLAAAVGSSFAKDISAVIADGKSWKAVRSDGGTMTMTLNPDGTGKMSAGIMRLNVRWKPFPKGFCLQGTPEGDKCVVLRKTPGGYQAYENNVLMLTLSR
jgi:hypothetical protein